MILIRNGEIYDFWIIRSNYCDVCLVNDSENDLRTTDMNGIQYCEKRNEICFMEGECIHKPDHAENEEWKLLWPVCEEWEIKDY